MPTPITPNRQTLDVPQVAAVLGISRRHAYDCVADGSIPSIKLGTRVVVPKRAVDDLLRGKAK